MTKLTKTKAFWATCLLSLLLFLAVCWSAAFRDSSPYWVASVGYFLLTWLCLDGFSKKVPDLNPWMIGLAAILGQLIIQIPVRCLDFYGSIGSLMIVVSCVIAILLAVICFKDRRPHSFVLAYVVMTLFNTCVAHMWDGYVLGIMH